MINIGVVGYGYWGPNIARAVAELDTARVGAIADRSPAARERAGRRHPWARLASDWRELVADASLDAIVVATPVESHFEIAMAALAAGKHVLVEKPIAETPAKAATMVEMAARLRRVLMVDHTFVYTPAVAKIRSLIDEGEIGDVYYYDSTRINLGLFQKDVNVIWDLAVHDLAIMDYLIDSEPVAISASAVACLPNGPENLAHVTVHYADGCMAHLNVNWLSPVKIRQTLIGGSRRMVVFDDMQMSEKIKVYDRGAALEGSSLETRVSYRLGDMWAPALSAKEALLTEMEEFVRCIETGARPLTDGEGGLRVVRLLDAASRSSRLRGQPVELLSTRAA